MFARSLEVLHVGMSCRIGQEPFPEFDRLVDFTSRYFAAFLDEAVGQHRAAASVKEIEHSVLNVPNLRPQFADVISQRLRVRPKQAVSVLPQQLNRRLTSSERLRRVQAGEPLQKWDRAVLFLKDGDSELSTG